MVGTEIGEDGMARCFLLACITVATDKDSCSWVFLLDFLNKDPHTGQIREKFGLLASSGEINFNVNHRNETRNVYNN